MPAVIFGHLNRSFYLLTYLLTYLLHAWKMDVKALYTEA